MLQNVSRYKEKQKFSTSGIEQYKGSRRSPLSKHIRATREEFRIPVFQLMKIVVICIMCKLIFSFNKVLHSLKSPSLFEYIIYTSTAIAGTYQTYYHTFLVFDSPRVFA